MKRREFMRHTGVSAGVLSASAGLSFLNPTLASHGSPDQSSVRRIDHSFSMNAQSVQIHLAGISPVAS